MDPILFETKIRYDAWFKVVMVLFLMLLVVRGIFFYLDANGPDNPPGKESRPK